MKKCFAVLLMLVLCLTAALAETDYAAMTDEELRALRTDALTELTAIQTELGRRLKAETYAGVSDSEALGKIKDLFPDEALAMFVRDKCGKFSIEQTVTQAELDEILYIQCFNNEHGSFQDLTGIGYLRNLRMFTLYNSMEYLGTEFPEEFYTLTNLYEIDLGHNCPNLCVLSESLGNLVNLKTLNIHYSKVSKLPDSIGNLTKLKELDIGNTKITELPDSIWNLELETVNMANLPIK